MQHSPRPAPAGAIIVNVCPPPCGSGKTHAVIHHSAEQVAAGERVAIISPTRRLVAQTAAGLMMAGCENVTAITGDTTSDPVAAVLRHVRDEARAPGVLLITHACHERLPYWHRPDRWHLIYDEAPAASWTETLNLPDTRDLLLPGLVVEPHSPDYLRVLPASGTHIRRIAANANGDDVYRLFSGTANKIISQHWSVFCDREQFDNLLAGRDDRRQLIFHALLDPSIMAGYRSATLLAADAGETALACGWGLRGDVALRETRMLDRHLRYTVHRNGPLLTVRWLSAEDWSKRHRDRSAGDGRTLLQHAVDRVGQHWHGQPFAWLGNNDLSDKLWGDADAVRLPNTSHGLNEFQHLHRAVLLSSLNPPPAHYSFLDAQGIDGEMAKTAIHRQALYQAACRISLRNPDDTTPKEVLVPDRATALWLAEKFPGCAVAELDGMPQGQKSKGGRPRLHESGAARQQAYRQRQRDQLLRGLAAANQPSDPAPAMAENPAMADQHPARQGAGRYENPFNIKGFRTESAPAMAASQPLGGQGADPLSLDICCLEGVDLTHADLARLFPDWTLEVHDMEAGGWTARLPFDIRGTPEFAATLFKEMLARLARAGYHPPERVARGKTKSKLTHGLSLSPEPITGPPTVVYDGDGRAPIDIDTALYRLLRFRDEPHLPDDPTPEQAARWAEWSLAHGGRMTPEQREGLEAVLEGTGGPLS